MANINVQVSTLNDLVIASDAISGGTANVISYPVVLGASYVVNISIQIATFSVDFKGNTVADCDNIGSVSNGNAVLLASGQLDPLTGTGAAATSYAGLQMYPISFVPGAIISVNGQAGVYVSYTVSYLSDLVVASFG